MVLFAALVALLPRPARALDAFEIQVYDGTANQPRAPGIEVHVNSVPSGRREANAPELPPHHQSHFTIEPSLGLFAWWEIGGYLQTALLGDGTFDYAGAKLRSKFVTPPAWSDRVRLGANVELAFLPEHYDRNRWGVELRPIAAYEDRRWVFGFNPIIGLPIAGPDLHAGPSCEPAAMALLKLFEVVSVGVEYYANLGPFSRFLPWREQEHTVFEVLNFIAWSHVEMGVGIGEGLTAASNPLTVKMIVGYSWERETAQPQ